MAVVAGVSLKHGLIGFCTNPKSIRKENFGVFLELLSERIKPS